MLDESHIKILLKKYVKQNTKESKLIMDLLCHIFNESRTYTNLLQLNSSGIDLTLESLELEKNVIYKMNINKLSTWEFNEDLIEDMKNAGLVLNECIDIEIINFNKYKSAPVFAITRIPDDKPGEFTIKEFTTYPEYIIKNTSLT